MKRVWILFTLLTIVLFGCKNENRIYKEYQDLSPQVKWKHDKILKFEVEVENINEIYQMIMAFRYAEGYQFSGLRVLIKEISPSGKETEKPYDIRVIDEAGNYIGEPALDLWDVEEIIEQNKKFVEKGTYTYIIKHNMPVDPVEFAMEIGLIVEKGQAYPQVKAERI